LSAAALSVLRKGTDLGINKDSSFHFQDLHLESLLNLDSKIDSCESATSSLMS
jgi:hypothetical protein